MIKPFSIPPTTDLSLERSAKIIWNGNSLKPHVFSQEQKSWNEMIFYEIMTLVYWRISWIQIKWGKLNTYILMGWCKKCNSIADLWGSILLHNPLIWNCSGGPGSISQWAHDPNIVKKKCGLLWHEKWWPDQVIILHISWQLSCHDMCKIVTWMVNQNKNWNKNIQIMSS